MNIEIRQKGNETSWEELTKLYHEAFQERLDQGMNFICSSFTPEYLEQLSAGSIILVALDKDNNDALAGAAIIEIKHDKKGTWGYLTDMGISPDYKRCGIGSKLEEKRIAIAKANNCSFVMSDTAVPAKSSVKWHLKNGFKIVELMSWPNTNYYSYNFRKQLVPHPLWSNSLFCKIHYWLSALKCKLMYHPDGKYRFPGVMNLIAKVHGLVFK
jgi:GNAT superfamily N-acetyltransferase